MYPRERPKPVQCGGCAHYDAAAVPLTGYGMCESADVQRAAVPGETEDLCHGFKPRKVAKSA